MADDTDTAEGAPAHGPAVAGKGKGKGKGLLNGPHREEIIVVCSVIGVGLAFLTLRRGGASAAGSSTPSAALSTVGPSASLGTGSGQLAGGYSDANQGLQQYLAQISDQLGGLEANLHPSAGQGVTPATPTPIAAGLFAPQYNGHYVRYGKGGIAEVEADGSQFNFTLDQWANAYKVAGAQGVQVTQLGEPVAPTQWGTQTNLDTAAQHFTPAPAPAK